VSFLLFIFAFKRVLFVFDISEICIYSLLLSLSSNTSSKFIIVLFESSSTVMFSILFFTYGEVSFTFSLEQEIRKRQTTLNIINLKTLLITNPFNIILNSINYYNLKSLLIRLICYFFFSFIFGTSTPIASSILPSISFAISGLSLKNIFEFSLP